MVILLCVFAGLLLNSAFAPLNFWFAAPLAHALLIFLLSDRVFKFRLLIVFVFGISFYLPLLVWSNTYVGNVPWILLSILQTVLLLPLSLLKLSRNHPWTYALFPSTIVAIEWTLARFPFGGFGWGRVGFSQASSPYSQLARIGGVPILTFFVSCLAVTILFLFFGEKGDRQFRTIGRIAGGVLASIVFLSLSLPLPHSGETFSVLGVQGGVPELGLNFNERAQAVYLLHRNATQKYLEANKEKIDVIFWPENAIDVDPLENVDISNEINSITSANHIPLIAGAVTHIGNEYFNESILWTPLTGPTSRYAKQHLTPFGEYMPWRALAEFVSPLARNVTDFSPGKFDVIHKVGLARIAPTICYELLDDSLGKSINVDSNFILVQTNSATFGQSSESAQQLNISRIRAIEHQRFVVSIATTGISAVIKPNGEIAQKTKQNVQSFIHADVKLISDRSISDRFGMVIEFVLIIFLLPFWWMGRRRSGSSQKP